MIYSHYKQLKKKNKKNVTSVDILKINIPFFVHSDVQLWNFLF